MGRERDHRSKRASGIGERRRCSKCHRALTFKRFKGCGAVCDDCRPPDRVRDNDAETKASLNKADAFIAEMRASVGGLSPPFDYPEITDAPPMERGLSVPGES